MTPRRRAMRIRIDHPRRTPCWSCRGGRSRIAWGDVRGVTMSAWICDRCGEASLTEQMSEVYDRKREGV